MHTEISRKDRTLAEKNESINDKIKYYELASVDLRKAVNINPENEALKRSLISTCLELREVYTKLAETEENIKKSSDYLVRATLNLNFASKLASSLSLSKENIRLESKTIKMLLELKKNSDKQSSFTILDKLGNEVVFSKLFAFDSNETGESYIVYTDNSKDDNGNINVYSSVFAVDPITKQQYLQPIESEKEWELVEKILNAIQKTIKEGIVLNEIESFIQKEIDEIEKSP